MTLSRLEEKTHICEVCGKQMANDRGLKVHKSKGCLGKPANPDIITKMLSLTEPAQILVKEVVQESPVVKEVVIAPVKSEVPEEFIKEPEKVIEVTVEKVPEQFEDVHAKFAKEAFDSVIAKVSEPVYVNPTKLGIKSVQLGSLVSMTGKVFHKVMSGFEMVDAPLEPGVVVKQYEDATKVVFLDLTVGDQIYTIPEHVVIPPDYNMVPTFKILRYGPDKGIVQNVAKTDQFEFDKEVFLEALKSYVDARDAKTIAETTYKKVDSSTRPVITKYVELAGSPKEGSNKNGRCVVEAGYEVHYSYKDPEVSHIREDEIIIDYLLSKGFKHALVEVTQYKILDEVWESLKKQGIIPEEFLNNVEFTKKGEPKRTLLVTKV
jgi:hypothetical protein